MQRTRHIYNKIIAAAAVFVVVVGCIMFVAVESANAGNRLQDTNSFGIGNQRHNIDTQVGVLSNNNYDDFDNFEVSATNLSTYTTRDITTAITSISYKLESAAQAAAEAARIAELLKSNNAKNNRNEYLHYHSMPSGLSEVNGDLTEEEFLAEGTLRINIYLAGSPLASTGEIFAQAAGDNGIDPRWSPAISNTESSKGCYCFASHNAGGGGNSSGGSGYDAIHSHVYGLANSYGYTISQHAAQVYCPPNSENGYSNTLREMQLI